MSYRPEWDSGGGHGRSFGGVGWSATKILLVSFGVMFVISLIANNFPIQVTESGQQVQRNPVLYFFSLRLDNFYWVYPLLSYAFLHDLGDLMHLIMNSLIIFFFAAVLITLFLQYLKRVLKAQGL